MGVLQNATKPTKADYNLHNVYLKAKQDWAQEGYIQERYAVPHQLAFHPFRIWANSAKNCSYLNTFTGIHFISQHTS